MDTAPETSDVQTTIAAMKQANAAFDKLVESFTGMADTDKEVFMEDIMTSCAESVPFDDGYLQTFVITSLQSIPEAAFKFLTWMLNHSQENVRTRGLKLLASVQLDTRVTPATQEAFFTAIRAIKPSAAQSIIGRFQAAQ